MSVTERVGGTVVVAEVGDQYSRRSTLCTAVANASDATTDVRKLCAAGCLRSRTSRRRVGRGKEGFVGTGFEVELFPEGEETGIGVGAGFDEDEDVGSIKARGGTGVVPAGSSAMAV